MACGVIIITSIMGISTIAIPICGGIALLPMGFIFFENTKLIADIENAIIKLKSEISDLAETTTRLELTNEDLHKTSDDLKSTKDSLIQETKSLEQMLTKANQEINNLSDILRKYKVIEHKLQNNVSNLESSNNILKQTTSELVNTKNSYEQQNKNLKVDIDLIETQLKEIMKLKVTYESNINTLVNNNETLHHSLDVLHTELENSKILYTEAKTAVKTLLIASGVLKDLGDDMVKIEKKTDENVTTLSNILDSFGRNRTGELYEKLDKNGDGLVDKEEFLNILIHSNDK